MIYVALLLSSITLSTFAKHHDFETRKEWREYKKEGNDIKYRDFKKGNYEN